MTPKQWGVILSVWLVSCCLKWKEEKSSCLLLATNRETENAKQNLQHLIRDHHLSNQEPYLYSVHEKNIKKFSNEIHNTLQENTVLYLSRKTRPLPKLGSALQDDGSILDMISLENIPKDTWTSPKHLFLKNHTIHYKDYLNNLFTSGKHKHPFHHEFEEGEKENLILQLTQILQISEKVIEDCLVLFLTSEEKEIIHRDENHLIVNKEGFFTQVAMDKISYSYNVPNDSKAFSEQALSQFFQHVEDLRKIHSDFLPAIFFSTIYTTVASSYKEVDKLFYSIEPSFFFLNAPLKNVVIDWAPQQQNSLIKTLYCISQRWIYHAIAYEILQDVCPDSEQEYVEAYRKLMRASALKQISRPLLFLTGLYKDLEEDTLAQKRIKTFERLARISLVGE